MIESRFGLRNNPSDDGSSMGPKLMDQRLKFVKFQEVVHGLDKKNHTTMRVSSEKGYFLGKIDLGMTIVSVVSVNTREGLGHQSMAKVVEACENFGYKPTMLWDEDNGLVSVDRAIGDLVMILSREFGEYATMDGDTTESQWSYAESLVGAVLA